MHSGTFRCFRTQAPWRSGRESRLSTRARPRHHLREALGQLGAAERLHEHGVRPELPVVLVSGYGGPDLNAAAAAAGAHAVLMKPLGSAELAQCLAQLMARARAGAQPGFAA